MDNPTSENASSSTDGGISKKGLMVATRRSLLAGCSAVATMALVHLMCDAIGKPKIDRIASEPESSEPEASLVSIRRKDPTLSSGKAKRIIYLHQNGAPSQLDLFDYKPALSQWHGTQLPDSIRGGQRLTELTANQVALELAASKFKFSQAGSSGMWVSELLPHHRSIVDKVSFVRSMHTEAINHVQATSLTHTGSELPGRPSFGAWTSFGLGHLNHDLPAYVVLTSKGSAYRGGESLQQRLWSNGFLPAEHQGVKFRSGGDAVMYLSNPLGLDRDLRRAQLDTLASLNRDTHAQYNDPHILARIEQFEMAFRMQASIPGLSDLSDEPESTYQLYGEQARIPGTYAYNCVMARRLAERDVRFIQLFHRGWDQHSSINYELPKQAKDIDQASAGLLIDLEQRGMLDETLVVWGSEFGRTAYAQGTLRDTDYGRDHHPRCFTVWLAGGGIKPGYVHGETDELGYNVAFGGVHVHDLNATLLHCLGIDHRKLTYHFKGREFRLTDVGGNVVGELLS